VKPDDGCSGSRPSRMRGASGARRIRVAFRERQGAKRVERSFRGEGAVTDIEYDPVKRARSVLELFLRLIRHAAGIRSGLP